MVLGLHGLVERPHLLDEIGEQGAMAQQRLELRPVDDVRFPLQPERQHQARPAIAHVSLQLRVHLHPGAKHSPSRFLGGAKKQFFIPKSNFEAPVKAS